MEAFSLSDSETDDSTDADDVDLVVSLSSAASVTLLSSIMSTTRVMTTVDYTASQLPEW